MELGDYSVCGLDRFLLRQPGAERRGTPDGRGGAAVEQLTIRSLKRSHSRCLADGISQTALARLESHGAIVRVEAEKVGTSIKMIGGPNRDNPIDRYSVEREL